MELSCVVVSPVALIEVELTSLEEVWVAPMGLPEVTQPRQAVKAARVWLPASGIVYEAGSEEARRQ